MIDGEKFLIEKIQNGSKDALAEVFDLYYDRIFRFAYRRTSSRETAEDITSEVFLNTIKNIENFQWRGNNSFRAWIYRIANNKICDYFRKNYQLKTIELEKAGQLQDDAQEPVEQTLILEESREELNQAIARLSPKDQQVINLTFFDEMKAPEIAEILECSVNSVYVRLHRALKKMRFALNSYPRKSA